MKQATRVQKKKSVKKKDSVQKKELILIDEKEGLIFKSEKDLFAYFSKYINVIEENYKSLLNPDDFSEKEREALESSLEDTLEVPDQVYKDNETLQDLVCHHFIKSFDEPENYTYVASCYVNSADEMPTFVFLHFATRDPQMIKAFQKGELIYDVSFEEVLPGAIEGDALSEGDYLALGLYRSMMKVRAASDIPQEEFSNYAELREEAIETADEIWRKVDISGNILVTFIKEFPDNEPEDLHYIAVTVEDDASHTHSLLFSFPTIDATLLDRYRKGENLQAEEVVHESSH